MVSDCLWTPQELQVRCRPFKREYGLFLKVCRSYRFFVIEVHSNEISTKNVGMTKSFLAEYLRLISSLDSIKLKFCNNVFGGVCLNTADTCYVSINSVRDWEFHHFDDDIVK